MAAGTYNLFRMVCNLLLLFPFCYQCSTSNLVSALVDKDYTCMYLLLLTYNLSPMYVSCHLFFCQPIISFISIHHLFNYVFMCLASIYLHTHLSSFSIFITYLYSSYIFFTYNLCVYRSIICQPNILFSLAIMYLPI